LKRGETPLIKSPEVIQDFIHISDVAGALLLLTEADGVSGDFNIGSGTATSVAEFVNIVSESSNSDFRLELPETLNGFWASIDKIKEVTSWGPKVSLIDGVTKTLKQLEMSHSG
jgi:nucleoside-diphosphate-sugar epimerase